MVLWHHNGVLTVLDAVTKLHKCVAEIKIKDNFAKKFQNYAHSVQHSNLV